MDLADLQVDDALTQWKAHPSGAAILFKQYVAAIEAPGGKASRKRTFVISTGSVDRDRDVLKVAGWDFENYLKNPVVLWAHSYSMLPVGKTESIVKRATALRATAEFAPEELNPFAEFVFRMIDGGYLHACSVGFRPLKWVFVEDRRGYDIIEMELLEYSIVPVPANPDALTEAARKGISLVPLKHWAEAVLDGFEPGLWVPKAAAKRALEIAAGEPKSISVPALEVEPAAVPLDADGVIELLKGRLANSGRTLSAAIEESLRAAETTTAVVEAALDGILPQPDDGDGKNGTGEDASSRPAEPRAFLDCLPPSLQTEEGVRSAVRGALTDAAHAELARVRGRLD